MIVQESADSPYKKTCQKFWNHIYQTGFMCAHRTEKKSPKLYLWIERSEKGEEKRFNYWIFTFLTQTWTIIQIHFLFPSASYFTLRIALHHHSDSDKIIIHRTSNGCKSLLSLCCFWNGIKFTKESISMCLHAVSWSIVSSLWIFRSFISSWFLGSINQKKKSKENGKMVREKLKRFL